MDKTLWPEVGEEHLSSSVRYRMTDATHRTHFGSSCVNIFKKACYIKAERIEVLRNIMRDI
jgi:hypothetical protein